jgi:uncharacterized OsmC-like protein
VVEFLTDSGLWEPQQLTFSMPGVRMYLISLLLCQHVYLVANAREKGIPLQEVQADFSVTSTSDWIITRVDGTFGISLDPAAEPSEPNSNRDEAIHYIQERMKLCPVSRNLPETVVKTINISQQI